MSLGQTSFQYKPFADRPVVSSKHSQQFLLSASAAISGIGRINSSASADEKLTPSTSANLASNSTTPINGGSFVGSIASPMMTPPMLSPEAIRFLSQNPSMGFPLFPPPRMDGAIPPGMHAASEAFRSMAAAGGGMPPLPLGLSGGLGPGSGPPMEFKNPGEAFSALGSPAHGMPGYYYDPTMAATYPYGTDRYGNPLDLNGARRKNATRETTAALKAWLYEHRKNPYPTKGEKIMLAIITKMTLTQVSTWFANARRRLKKENKMTWSPRNRTGEDDDDDDIGNDGQGNGNGSDDEDLDDIADGQTTLNDDISLKTHPHSMHHIICRSPPHHSDHQSNHHHHSHNGNKRKEEHLDGGSSLSSRPSSSTLLCSPEADAFRLGMFARMPVMPAQPTTATISCASSALPSQPPSAKKAKIWSIAETAGIGDDQDCNSSAEASTKPSSVSEKSEPVHHSSAKSTSTDRSSSGTLASPRITSSAADGQQPVPKQSPLGPFGAHEGHHAPPPGVGAPFNFAFNPWAAHFNATLAGLHGGRPPLGGFLPPGFPHAGVPGGYSPLNFLNPLQLGPPPSHPGGLFHHPAVPSASAHADFLMAQQRAAAGFLSPASMPGHLLPLSLNGAMTFASMAASPLSNSSPVSATSATTTSKGSLSSLSSLSLSAGITAAAVSSGSSASNSANSNTSSSSSSAAVTRTSPASTTTTDHNGISQSNSEREQQPSITNSAKSVATLNGRSSAEHHQSNGSAGQMVTAQGDAKTAVSVSKHHRKRSGSNGSSVRRISHSSTEETTA